MGVYIIGISEVENLYKIGFTRDIDSRLSSAQTNNHQKLFLVKFFKDGSRQFEKHLHELFQKNKKQGEFFKLSKEELEFILNKKNPSQKEEWLDYELDMPWVLK